MSSFDPETGIWLVADKDSPEHVFDERLALAITFLMEMNNYRLPNDKMGYSILDLGCGLGHYVDFFRQSQYVASGYDGNPNTLHLTNGRGGRFGILDLSKPITTELNASLVLSLEVGEHIPAQFEEVFLDNVTITARDVVILSWAIPEQGGLGHVNCRPNEYIIAKVEERGFTHVPELSAFLRYYASLSWFRNTLMVFKRKVEDAQTN